MPGVVVTTAVRTGPTVANVAPSATFFVAGITERGPVDRAVLVTSLTEFEDYYGGFVSYGFVHQQVQTFFEEGGARCYIGRTVGASPGATSSNTSTGVLALAEPAGTAVTLTASGPGDWSANLKVTVTQLGAANSRAVKFFLNNEQVYSTGECANAAVIVNKINSSPIAARYATATLSAGKDATFLTVVSTPTALSSGSDNRTNITLTNYSNALALFTDDLGSGAVALPGVAGSSGTATTLAIHTALIAHANTNSRIALCSFPSTFVSTDAIAQMSNYGLADDSSEHSAFFWPWVTANRAVNTPMTISPEGYVAAKRSVTFNAIGPWAPYAGLTSEASFITGLAATTGKTIGDALDAARVNALRIINGRVRIYGARSASSDEDNFRYITAQEMINYIVVEAQNRLEDLVFSTIDGRGSLFGQVDARLRALLDPIRTAGGLYEAFDSLGNRIDYGYTVVVNEAINPVSQLAGGLIKAKVGVRVSSIGDQIQVEVTKSNLTASVV
jgi:hypothetical protein